jgi:hypothetical protein
MATGLPFLLGTQNSVLDYTYPDTVYQVAQAMGCSLFRFDLPWNYAKGNWPGLELTPGSFASLTSLTAVLAKCDTYRLKPIIVVDGLLAPTYPNATYPNIPVSPAQFATAMSYLVTNCPGRTWEIMNEPDLTGTQDNNPFTVSISPATYTAAVQVAYTAMKAADPTCTVNVFTVSSVDAGDTGRVFVAGCYSAGILGSYDRRSWHIYPYPTDNSPASGYSGTSLITALTQMAAQATAASDSTPLDITEFGWQSSDKTMTAALQAQYVQTFLEDLATWGGASRVCIYQCADAGGTWGMTSGTFVNKQAYQAVTDLLPDSNRFASSSGTRKRVT